MKVPNTEASWNRLYDSYKRNGLRRKFDFSLTKEEFKNLSLKNCYYCNAIPSREYNCYKNKKDGSPKRKRKSIEIIQQLEKATIIVNGVDRKINSIGYTSANCLPCCQLCNKMKSNLSFEDFLTQIQKIWINKI